MKLKGDMIWPSSHLDLHRVLCYGAKVHDASWSVAFKQFINLPRPYHIMFPPQNRVRHLYFYLLHFCVDVWAVADEPFLYLQTRTTTWIK
jgi:hypothetical protein